MSYMTYFRKWIVSYVTYLENDYVVCDIIRIVTVDVHRHVCRSQNGFYVILVGFEVIFRGFEAILRKYGKETRRSLFSVGGDYSVWAAFSLFFSRFASCRSHRNSRGKSPFAPYKSNASS